MGISGSHPERHLSSELSDGMSCGLAYSRCEGGFFEADVSRERRVKTVGSLLEAAKDIISLG